MAAGFHDATIKPKNRRVAPRGMAGRGGAGGVWPAALLLTLLLAGCSGGPEVPPGIPVDGKGRALPTLEGTVVDERILPLAGVEVRLLGTDVSTLTGADGRYAIQRPTGQAEAALVTAFKPGFVPRTQQAQLSGRLPSHLDFMLSADGTLVPRVDALSYTGALRCLVGASVAGQAQGVDCAGDRRDDEDVLPPWLWDVNPTPNLAGAVFEVAWQPQTAGADVLRAWLKAPMAGGQGGEVVADATGTSPLRLEVPQAVAQAMPRWTAIRLHVDVAEGDGGAGAATGDQRFGAVASLFYVDPAPPGYLAG